MQPFAEFVKQLTPTMLSIDPNFVCEPKMDRTISRIFRDMRRATDGYRYRENMWCIFARDKRQYGEMPGYYFEISPYSFSFGCGFYRADATTIKNYRRLIASGSKQFTDAFAAVNSQPELKLYGDAAKIARPKKMTDEVYDWYCRTNIGVSAESNDYALLMSDALAPFLAETFSAIAPFYHLILSAELS